MIVLGFPWAYFYLGGLAHQCGFEVEFIDECRREFVPEGIGKTHAVMISVTTSSVKNAQKVAKIAKEHDILVVWGKKGVRYLLWFYFKLTHMARTLRVDIGDQIYHVLNRSNGRLTIFKKDQDYQAFECIMEEARSVYSMRILVYCLMPNHWHLILYPFHDGDLNRFMQWLTLTHTQRWHSHFQSVGYGHLYQGRYKSFLIQEDEHFLQVARYIEGNALRAGLVKKAENWQWSSLWRRTFGTAKEKKLLTSWPIAISKNYLNEINGLEYNNELVLIREIVIKNKPFGDNSWSNRMIERFGLEMTLRSRGRPKKGT